MTGYSITSKGGVLTKFETRWWQESLNENQRLIMLSLYLNKGRPMDIYEIADFSGVGSAIISERELRELIAWGYAEKGKE